MVAAAGAGVASVEHDYFDPRPSGESGSDGLGMQRRAFRLLRLTDQSDGVLRYVVTPEGITAYLSMLDVDPTLAQQAEEILVQRLMDRGRFRDARRLARRHGISTQEPGGDQRLAGASPPAQDGWVPTVP